jgi:hypothetical protein
MEGPPTARAPLGRPTLLTDLPGDVLAYILSFIPFEEWDLNRAPVRLVASRFVAAAACTELAAAARPPSAAWTDVDVPKRFFFARHASTAAGNALRDAMARAAPSVRRLSVRGLYSHCDTSAVVATMVSFPWVILSQRPQPG